MNFPPVCRAPENGKSHEESYDSSWDFGALEGTRIPGPLIKSQMLYRLSYERIFCSKTILPNNITTIDCKKQEQRRKSGNSRASARICGGRDFPAHSIRRKPVRAAYDWVLLCSVCSRQCSAPKPACGAYPAAHAPVGQKKQCGAAVSRYYI